jgi:hypothetical protein
MVVGRLIVCGKTITVDNLHDLPENLSYEEAFLDKNDTKSPVVVKGLGHPLSTKFPVKIEIEGVNFTSVEHLRIPQSSNMR